MTGHLPVLLPQVLEWIRPRSGGFYVDGTVGWGGHASAILDASGPAGRLLGIDRDPCALSAAGERLASFGGRVGLVHGKASQIAAIMDRLHMEAPDGVLLDLGVSSPQLDQPERGFSFQSDGPLDMRMDTTQALTADEVVNQWPEDALVRVIREYGEERRARRVAEHILAARPIRGTRHLADVVERALGGRQGQRIHPATRSFQGLRMAVNDELNEVRQAVDAALDVVVPGGRVVVISFHSLEDGCVKGRFADACGIGTPRDPYGNPIVKPRFRRLTASAVKGADLDPNPRARSARLRVVERLVPMADGRTRGRQ